MLALLVISLHTVHAKVCGHRLTNALIFQKLRCVIFYLGTHCAWLGIAGNLLFIQFFYIFCFWMSIRRVEILLR